MTKWQSGVVISLRDTIIECIDLRLTVHNPSPLSTHMGSDGSRYLSDQSGSLPDTPHSRPGSEYSMDILTHPHIYAPRERDQTSTDPTLPWPHPLEVSPIRQVSNPPVPHTSTQLNVLATHPTQMDYRVMPATPAVHLTTNQAYVNGTASVLPYQPATTLHLPPPGLSTTSYQRSRPDKVRLPIYDGQTCWEDFYNHFDLIAEKSGWDEDTRWLQISSCLR